MRVAFPLRLALEGAPPPRGGLRGTGFGLRVALFRGAFRSLEESAHHQRDRAGLPGSATPHPAHVQLFESGQLRPHRFSASSVISTVPGKENPSPNLHKILDATLPKSALDNR